MLQDSGYSNWLDGWPQGQSSCAPCFQTQLGLADGFAADSGQCNCHGSRRWYSDTQHISDGSSAGVDCGYRHRNARCLPCMSYTVANTGHFGSLTLSMAGRWAAGTGAAWHCLQSLSSCPACILRGSGVHRAGGPGGRTIDAVFMQLCAMICVSFLCHASSDVACGEAHHYTCCDLARGDLATISIRALE